MSLVPISNCRTLGSSFSRSRLLGVSVTLCGVGNSYSNEKTPGRVLRMSVTLQKKAIYDKIIRNNNTQKNLPFAALSECEIVNIIARFVGRKEQLNGRVFARPRANLVGIDSVHQEVIYGLSRVRTIWKSQDLFRFQLGINNGSSCSPVIDTLMANAITLSAIVGVTVIKCQEFSSG